MESDAAEPLAIIAEARAALADRHITPWWYYPIPVQLLVGIGLGSTPVKLDAPLFGVGCVMPATAYRRLTGVLASGLDTGRTSRWAKALGALVSVVAIAACGIRHLTQLVWPVWCLAAASHGATVALGRQFDVARRAQLRADA